VSGYSGLGQMEVGDIYLTSGGLWLVLHLAGQGGFLLALCHLSLGQN
jgi:hypothetical protein